MKMMTDYSPAAYEFRSLFTGSWLSYLVGLYVFAFYLELHTRFSILAAIRFQFTFGAFLSVVCLFKFFSEKKANQSLSPVTKTVFLLLVIMGVYTVFAMDRSEAIRVYSDRVLKFSLVAFFIYVATNKIADLRVILAFMLLAWLKLGQEGFIGWFTGSMVWENQGIPRLRGSTAMFGHPNSFSGFAVGCLPFCIFLLMGVKSKLLKLGLLALLGCALIIIVNTGSRTGYVAVILGGIYFFMKLKRGKLKILLASLLVMSLGVGFIPEAYKERFYSIFTGEEKEGQSSEKRMEIIEDALILYSEYPLGVGVASFMKVRGQLFGRYQDTHNLYLEVLTNIGPFGLIVFLLFVTKLIRLNNRNIKLLEARADVSSVDTQLLVNLSRAVTGFIFVRLILGIFGMDLYEIYWWIALGYALAIQKLTVGLPASPKLEPALAER